MIACFAKDNNYVIEFRLELDFDNDGKSDENEEGISVMPTI